MSDYGGSGDHFNDCSGIGGCDCDERRYGQRGGGSGGGNGSLMWLLIVIGWCFIGAWNELVGIVLGIFLLFVILFR